MSNIHTTGSTLQPNGPEMARVRAELESRLKESITHLVVDSAPLPDIIAVACKDRVTMLETAHIDPASFGLNAALRNAALANDLTELDRLRAIFATWEFPRRLGREGSENPAITVLGTQSYDPARVQLLTNLYGDDTGLTTNLVAPPSDVSDAQSPVIRRACDIIAEATPEWFDELDMLVSEVLLAINDRTVDGRNFAGGSTFDLFGSILVNPAYRSSVAHYMMTLIHESSHLRLFCHHLDDEIVLNAPEERFASPLRRDSRPMEGVFHAMWVSARMAAFGIDVLRSPQTAHLLSADELDDMRAQIDAARRAFLDAHEVVERHGILTDFGWKLVRDAALEHAEA